MKGFADKHSFVLIKLHILNTHSSLDVDHMVINWFIKLIFLMTCLRTHYGSLSHWPLENLIVRDHVRPLVLCSIWIVQE